MTDEIWPERKIMLRYHNLLYGFHIHWHRQLTNNQITSFQHNLDLGCRPTAVDLTTADTSQNDVQPRSSTRSRSHADNVPSNSRRSSRRGTATPDVDASGNSAGGVSVQRTSRKINSDTNGRPSFKNTRRGTSSKKLTTEATSVKDEIDESENYPPEFIQKIKSSVDTKDEKTTQSSLLSSSPEDTFITKSSDKVVSVFTPSLSEDGTNAEEDKDNQNNEIHLNKLETRRRPNKYTGRARSYKTGSDETGKQRKVDLLLAPSPPSEREVTKSTVHSSSRSQYKSSNGYSLRGSRPLDSKKDTATEYTKKAEISLPPTPDTLQLDSPITSPTQSTRAAFRTKSNLRSHHISKPETENIVTAPGGPDIQNSQDPSPRPSFRRAFPTRSRSAAYKSQPSRNEQTSASTEDNVISSRSYTPRPTSSKTRTTSSFRRSIAATTDDIQNEIQTSAQPISDTKKFIPGTESIVVSASDRSVIPTVTQRFQPQVTFALPSEVSNSVYSVQGSKYSNYWSSSTTEKPKFHYITSNSISTEISTSTPIPLFIVTPEPATSSTTKIIYKWKPVIDKGNIAPSISTASTIGSSTASPVMTVTAKRQLTTMTPLPVSSYITERLVTVTPVVQLTNNSSQKPVNVSPASAEAKTVAVTSKPATSQPTIATAAPAKVTTIKTTTKATTVKPTTVKTTMTTAASLKTTSLKPTTLKPTTSKPSTPKPTTSKPTTAKPTTSKPSMAKSTTSKPTTVKPTTPKPTTTRPTTPKPTTGKPTTPKSTTPKPTTPKPTTPKPATPKPTTPKPTTSKPTTPKPAASKSTTPKPTTSKPTTPKPTTSKPNTPKPTTSKPNTPKPTTSKPTTPKPTTPKPTTPKPTTPKPTTTKLASSVPTTPKPTTSKPTTPKAPTPQPIVPKPATSKPMQKTTLPQPQPKFTVAQTATDLASTTSTPLLITSPRNSITYSSLSTLESDIKHVESESVHERNSWQTLNGQGSLEELSLLNILAQNIGGRQEQRKTNLADKVIEAALQRSSTTALPLSINNLPKTKVVQTLENGVESNRFSLDLLGQQSRNINADDVTEAPTVTSSIVELETSKNTPVVSSKSPTVETVTSGKLSPQDEQLLLALFGNQISGALQQPKSQNSRSRSRLSPEEQLLASLLREQASAANLKTSSKGGQQQKEQNSEQHSLSTTSTRPKSQGLPASGKLSEEELLLSLLGGQPKTMQKATEQVNSTRTKLSDEEILAALLSGQSKGATRTVATTQRVSTKPKRLLTDEQIIAGLLTGSTPATPADQARLVELLSGGRHRTRKTTTTTPAVPRGLGFLLARPGSQGLFSSALQPDAGSIDPGLDLGGGEDGFRGPREQGTLVKAAIDVTKAVSQFMSAVIQGATRSFQSFFRSGTNLLSQYFSLGSAQAGNFQLR